MFSYAQVLKAIQYFTDQKINTQKLPIPSAPKLRCALLLHWHTCLPSPIPVIHGWDIAPVIPAIAWDPLWTIPDDYTRGGCSKSTYTSQSFRHQLLLWTLLDSLRTKVGWRLQRNRWLQQLRAAVRESGVGKNAFSQHNPIYLKRQWPSPASYSKKTLEHRIGWF